MPDPADSRPRRRTQAERREATRTALLDATIDCLVEFGYAGTTTARVADRAGVSRGAQIHYFRSKAELVVAAVEHLARRRMDELRPAVPDLPRSGPARLELLLDLVREVHRSSVFDATLELWVASRTDPELHDRVVELERNVGRTIRARLAEIFTEDDLHPGLREDVEIVLATARGLALLRIAGGENAAAETRRWNAIRGRLVELMAPDARPAE